MIKKLENSELEGTIHIDEHNRDKDFYIDVKRS